MIGRRLFLIAFGAALAVIIAIAVEAILALCDLGEETPASPVQFNRGVPSQSQLTYWDRDLLYRLPPNSEFLGYYRTNDRGYRGSAFPESGDAFRVVCLGDSCTFGLGVQEADSWPAQLERGLQTLLDGVASAQVLNLGVPGYSSFQNRRQIETEVLDLRPDVVVLLPTGFNDANRSQGATDRERAEANASLLARLSRTRLARVMGSATPAPPYTEGVGLAAHDEQPSPRVPLDELATQLAFARDTLESERIPLILLAPALDSLLLEQDPSLSERSAVVREGGGIDLREEFDAVRPWPLTVDGLHPNESGSALIAGAALLEIADHFAATDPSSTSDSSATRSLPPSVHGRFVFWSELHRSMDEGLNAAEAEEWMIAAPPVVVSYRDGDAEAVAALRSHSPTARDPVYLWELLELEWTAALEARAWRGIANARPSSPFHRLLFGESAIRSMGPTATEGVLRDLSKDTFSKARVLSAFIGSMGLQGPQTQKEVLQSITCRNAGDYSGALAAADEALTVNPTSAEARHQRILALTYLGKHAVAMTEAITLAADEPSKPRLQLSVGLMLVQRGRTAEARPYLERGVEGCPVDPEGLSALGRILIGTGEYDRAEELLRAAHAINAQRAPDVPSLLETIATLRAEASESPPK